MTGLCPPHQRDCKTIGSQVSISVKITYRLGMVEDGFSTQTSGNRVGLDGSD